MFAMYYFFLASLTFIPNTSILSILVGSFFAFIIPFLFFLNKRIEIVLFISIAVLIFVFILLFTTKGRAGFLGLLFASVYFIFKKYKYSKSILKYHVVSFCIILFFTFLLVLYKIDSSNGRLLIYKVSYKIFTDNPLFGVGFGNFKANYNSYQAVYFASHNIDSKEALLADNTFYAFNDYYQFVLENGIVGFTILMLIGFFFYKKIWKVNFTQKQLPLATAAKASIICILVAALFSYPLQILPIIFQFVFCVSMLTFFAINTNTVLTKNCKLFYKSIAVFLLLLFLLFATLQVNYKIKSAEALELSRAGFKIKATEKYKELSKSFFNDGNDMFLYAKELYNTKQIAKAKEVLDIAKTKISFNEIYKLSADIGIEEREFVKAEKDLKTVVYMIPNRMQPRLNLMEFYLSQNDITQATYWANSINNMPVKIPSETTRAIQQKVKVFLKK